jgi:hypothetical protein
MRILTESDNPTVFVAGVCSFLGPGVRNVMLQNGAATGDVFQVASALKLHREFAVVIVSAPNNPRDRGLWIRNYYVREWGISSARVVLRVAADPERMIGAINANKLFLNHHLNSGTVGWATNLLRDDLAPGQPSNADRLRKCILGMHLEHSASIEKLAGFCEMQQIPLGRKIVVLWSRRSGKAGGLHPDLDSSTTVMAQVAGALRHTHVVLVVGDLPEIKMTEHPGFQGAIFLGEFWKRGFDCPERSAQILLFEFLRRNSVSLVHLGMRSGTLDGYAIAGHKVVYILDSASLESDDARMGKLLSDKVLLNYRRVAISKAPKLFGQLSRARGEELLDGFDLKGKLIEVRKTGKALDADQDIKKCFLLLEEFLRKSPKTVQYRFFKTDVVTNMSPLFQKEAPAQAKPAVELLRQLYAELVEFVLARVRSRRELDREDLVKILAEIGD